MMSLNTYHYTLVFQVAQIPDRKKIKKNTEWKEPASFQQVKNLSMEETEGGHKLEVTFVCIDVALLNWLG